MNNDQSLVDKLKELNQRLKIANLGVTIRRRSDRLYIRAVFPSKPWSQKDQPLQQDLATGCRANLHSLKQVEKLAKKVAGELAGGEFNWLNYVTPPVEHNSQNIVAAALARFETDYFQRRQRTVRSESSWKAAYRNYLNRLPQDQPVTVELLRTAILETQPDSCSRSRMCSACRKFGSFAGLEVNELASLRGSYSSLKPAPRNLPTDDVIITAISEISHQGWCWVAGVMAVYGLRPHEVFHIDTTDLESGKSLMIYVKDNTKTGARSVLPLHREWVEILQLRQKYFPSINTVGKCNKKLGEKVGKAFRRYRLPFRPYDLRHAWAVRAIGYNFPVSESARWMGHSVTMHTTIYQKWISKDVTLAIYEAKIREREAQIAAFQPTVSALPQAEVQTVDSSPQLQVA